MMEQTLYLVRHAESTMSGRYCGSTDAPLSRAGRGQAQKIARFFRAIPLQACYVSDLKRARQTFQYFQLPSQTIPTPSPQLREIHFGEWEAKSYGSVSRGWPEIYPRWVESPATVDIPRGEPFGDFFARVKAFSKSIAAGAPGDVAVVAHGGSLAVLSMILLKRPLREFWQWLPKTASISMLRRRVKGGSALFRLESLSGCAHLA